MKIRKGRKAEQGFTLIELLVVVAIIALLAAVAVPSLIKAADKSYGARGKSDVQTVAAALDRFYMEQGFYPTDLKYLVVAGYMKTTDFKNGYGLTYFYAVNDLSQPEVWDVTNKKFTTRSSASAYALGDPGKSAQTAGNSGSTFTCALSQASINAGTDGSMCPMLNGTGAWSLYNAGSQGIYIVTQVTSTDGVTYPDSNHSLKGFSKNLITE